MPRFTDRYIKSLETKPKAYDIREGAGFGIRVLPSGTKTWFHLYTLKGTKKRISYGTYPGLSLSEAHDEHGTDRRLLDKGIDPAEARRQADDESRAAPTVQRLADEYIERWAKPRKRSWVDDRRQLDKDVLSRWGKRKAEEITRKDVVALLADVVDRGSPVSSNRLLACVRRMFNWGIEVGLVESSPCVRIRAPGKETRKERVLTDEEIRAVWQAWEDGGATSETRRALQLILVTAQRPGEIVGIQRREISGTWWTIPGDRAKNGRAHRVPLSDLALELIGKGKGYVFPGKDGVGPMTGGALSRATRRHAKLEPEPVKSRGKGIYRRHKPPAVWKVEPFTPHDLRRTAASHMTGMGISRLVVGQILNHAESGVTAVYDRHSYDAEKKKALGAWGRKLRQIVEGKKPDNVVSISSAG